MMTTGRCLCGNVRWQYDGEVTWACYCHCDDCRRNCAAPVVAWLGVPLSKFKWLGEVPGMYKSSEGVKRHFCKNCGTPMAFEADHYKGVMHLYAASLDNPEQFEPTFHVNHDSKLSWLKLEDNLKKYSGRLLDSSEDISAYDS